MMKKLTFFMIIVLLVTSCGTKEKNSDRVKVYTTLFPQYDFAKQIGGDLVDVEMILPPGIDGHQFELSPKDLKNLKESDLFIYTSDEMEPWVEKIRADLESSGVKIVDASKGVSKLESISENSHNHEEHEDDKHNHNDTHEDDEHDHNDDHEHSGKDPHYWLDLSNAQIMVDNIYLALSDIDVDNSETYFNTASAYKTKLELLDNDFKEMVNSANQDTIVFVGHFALNYFTSRYNLHYYVVYSGDIEPSANAMIEMIDVINREEITIIFVEENSNQNVAKLVSEETGTDILELHSLHNVTLSQKEKGITYLELMEQNFENLKLGLR